MIDWIFVGEIASCPMSVGELATEVWVHGDETELTETPGLGAGLMDGTVLGMDAKYSPENGGTL